MLKKSLFPILLIAVFFVSACSEAETEPTRLLNAEDYEGQLIADRRAVPDGLAAEAPPPEVPAVSPPEVPAVTESTTAPDRQADPAPASTSPPPDRQAVPSSTAPPPDEQTNPIPADIITPPVPAPPPTPAGAYAPLNYSEVKGVWISFIELQGAFAGRSEAGFRSVFAAMMDNCKSLGINTVYVHVRAHGDSYYKSELFPWARQITGIMGVAPDFDPLAIMIEEAHSRGISFRAWINPMRLMSDADMQRVSADFPDLPVSKWHKGGGNGTHIVKVGSHWYLNPAEPEVRKLIADGAAEILRNYNVDGLHIDDYFYPPNSGESFDRTAFLNSGQASLTQFRLDNATKMVKSLYDTVKSINPSVLFGISPQGSIENCYEIYADVNKWASEAGYCDYIAPQLYYGFLNVAQPFDKCLRQWEELVAGTDIKLLIGLAVYKIGEVDAWAGAGEAGRNEWLNSSDIIKRQISLSKQAENYGGYIFFSYRFLFESGFNSPAINAQLQSAGIT
ncbi:MAG: family 10 glycosylhydrolase [Oscillospiraceae bacterium]|nr:family 10 glycosylhydrolase [Oscillospiraceae bacterium]